MLTLETPELPHSTMLFGRVPMKWGSSSKFAFGDRMLVAPWGKEEILLRDDSGETEIAYREPNSCGFIDYRGPIRGENFSLKIQKQGGLFSRKEMRIHPEGHSEFVVKFHWPAGLFLQGDFCKIKVGPDEPKLERWVRVECPEEFEILGMIICAYCRGYLFEKLSPSGT